MQYNGSSTGACVAAYYASKKPLPLGPSVYWEELTRGFILGHNIPFGTFQRFCNRYFGCYPGKLIHAVDIDLVIDVISKGEKALDFGAFKSCSFSVFVKLWDVRNKCWHFIDLRTCDDPLKIIRASISLVPYYFSSENINGIEYIDLCSSDALNLELIVSRHPASKIVFVINNVERPMLILKIIRFLEGLVANWCFEEIDTNCFIEGMLKFEQDVEKIKTNPNMLLVSPPEGTPIKPFTTDPEKLKRTYEIGKQEAQKILDFAKRQ